MGGEGKGREGRGKEERGKERRREGRAGEGKERGGEGKKTPVNVGWLRACYSSFLATNNEAAA